MNRKKTRLRPTRKISTNKKKVANTPTATLHRQRTARRPRRRTGPMGGLHSARNPQSRRLVDGSKNGMTPRLLMWSRMFWKQARMIAKHHHERWTKLRSKWRPAMSTKQKGYRKQGRPAKRWGRRHQVIPAPTEVHGDKNDLTNNTTWLTTGQDIPWKATL